MISFVFQHMMDPRILKIFACAILDTSLPEHRWHNRRVYTPVAAILIASEFRHWAIFAIFSYLRIKKRSFLVSCNINNSCSDLPQENCTKIPQNNIINTMIFPLTFLRSLFLKERKDTDIICFSLHDRYPGSQNPGNISPLNPVYNLPEHRWHNKRFYTQIAQILIASEFRHWAIFAIFSYLRIKSPIVRTEHGL